MDKRIYSHVSELFAQARKNHVPMDGSERFYGTPDTEGAIAFCERGITDDMLRPARELIEKVDSSFRDREAHAWQPSITGPRASVGDYLAGKPLNMRRRQRVESDVSPLRIVLECTVSAGVSASTMARRAAAIAALVMRSSEERPVELWAAWAATINYVDHVGMVKLDTTPISLAQVISIFTREFARRIVFASWYSFHTRMRSEAGIRWGLGTPGTESRAQRMRKELQLDAQDVLIQGGYLPDAQLMDSDPVAWVHKQLEKQREIQD